MAGSSLLVLIDDIATVLDDVAILSKVAAKKTAGVLGDDLALNAEQVSGVKADRELAVVWAVAKGSFAREAMSRARGQIQSSSGVHFKTKIGEKGTCTRHVQLYMYSEDTGDSGAARTRACVHHALRTRANRTCARSTERLFVAYRRCDDSHGAET